MHEIPAFHPTGHGSSVQLSDGNCLATRCPASVSNAVVFSSRPLVANQKIRLELVTTDDWSVAGTLRIGLTCVDPGGLTEADLPEYAFPDLAERRDFWVRTVDKYLGDRVPRCVTLCLTSEGTLMFGPDRETKVVLLRTLPVDKQVWLLVDVYGRTTGVRIVPPDDVPEEILALGPSSVRSYEAACEAGYQAVYRTRLVLLGRDRAGKSCMRSRLIGSSIGEKFGLSTSAIDLSASCSFSLSNQSRWKLAASPEEIIPANTKPDYDGNSNEDDAESRNVAIATNMALKILHQRKDRIRKDANRIYPENYKSPTQTNTHPTSLSTNNPRIECTTDVIEDVEDVPNCSETSGPNKAELSQLKNLPKDVVPLVLDILADANRRKQKAFGTGIFCQPPHQRLNGSWSQRERDVLFNVLDCSGDEAYYATNQVYLSSRAIYIFVFDLRQDLEERRRVPTPNKTNDQQNESDDMEMSYLDYVDFWLRTIRAHASLASTRPPCSTDAASASSVDFPPVFIIGSNRDALHTDRGEQQKLAEEKFSRIREAIKGQPYEGQVIRQYYAISSNSEMESEIEQMDLLRCHIETIARSLPYMGEFIPSRWLNFELSVDRLVAAGTNFCSLGQLHEVALEEGITGNDEFETVVQYYHELGLLIHLGSDEGHCLSNSVIIKPLWLVDVCKSILAADDHLSHLSKKPLDEVAWSQYSQNGILWESLLDLLLGKSLDQRPVILGCMEKLDLIVERSLAIETSPLDKRSGRSFVIPFRFGSLPDKVLYRPRSQDISFYYDFCDFLPDVLFYKILAHTYRWSQGFGGNEPQLVRGSGRFYFDREHDFVVIMAPKHLARIKVVILRVLDLDSGESDDGSVEEDRTEEPPKPFVTAKVRNFFELTLCELRESWMKRLAYTANVRCWCDQPCITHSTVRCPEENCLHFLSLDECLSNKVVYCDHRRCKTSVFRRGFPTSKHFVKQKPVPIDRNSRNQSNGNAKAVAVELPVWAKNAAKLLNGGSDGLDWIALAKKFGYKRNKIENFNYDANPALALITDWIISSGNTALSIDMMVSFLEQMHRDDIVEVIQKGQEVEVNHPQVFISYQWEVQDDVAVLRDVLERNGLTCWMDIGQMGGGDHLYAKIYEGIKNSKVMIVCLTHKYLVSHYCSRELALADLLHKPIIPVLFEMVAWPPAGPMALIFSTLVYVNLKGVGGHGGSGIHADLEAKYQEIVTRVSNLATPRFQPFISLSPLSSAEDHSPNESIAPSSAPGQQRSSDFYTPYGLQGELQSNRQQASRVGIRGTSRPSGPDGGAHRVTPVHVAKCVVCTLL